MQISLPSNYLNDLETLSTLCYYIKLLKCQLKWKVSRTHISNDYIIYSRVLEKPVPEDEQRTFPSCQCYGTSNPYSCKSKTPLPTYYRHNPLILSKLDLRCFRRARYTQVLHSREVSEVQKFSMRFMQLVVACESFTHLLMASSSRLLHTLLHESGVSSNSMIGSTQIQDERRDQTGISWLELEAVLLLAL